jgi:predicted PolB exonuclease-like 3'-5' exonuclease
VRRDFNNKPHQQAPLNPQGGFMIWFYYITCKGCLTYSAFAGFIIMGNGVLKMKTNKQHLTEMINWCEEQLKLNYWKREKRLTKKTLKSAINEYKFNLQRYN